MIDPESSFLLSRIIKVAREWSSRGLYTHTHTHIYTSIILIWCCLKKIFLYSQKEILLWNILSNISIREVIKLQSNFFFFKQKSSYCRDFYYFLLVELLYCLKRITINKWAEYLTMEYNIIIVNFILWLFI